MSPAAFASADEIEFIRCRKSEVRSKRSEIRSQKQEAGGKKTETRTRSVAGILSGGRSHCRYRRHNRSDRPQSKDEGHPSRASFDFASLRMLIDAIPTHAYTGSPSAVFGWRP